MAKTNATSWRCFEGMRGNDVMGMSREESEDLGISAWFSFRGLIKGARKNGGHCYLDKEWISPAANSASIELRSTFFARPIGLSGCGSRGAKYLDGKARRDKLFWKEAI